MAQPGMSELRPLASATATSPLPGIRASKTASGKCSRCRTTIPHPLLVAGSLIFHGETVRKLLPLVERLTYFSKLPKRLLTPQRPVPAAAPKVELVQIK